MKQSKKIMGIAFVSLMFTACQKDSRFATEINAPEKNTDAAATVARGSHNDNNESGPGMVYTLSNQAGGNKVLAYRRAATGQLTFDAAYFTGGTGTGGGLGNQGAVVVTDDDKFLLAVNAGSHSVSSLKITGNRLNLRSTVNSGGIQPVSVAAFKDLVYVLNAGGNGTISGFRLLENGRLIPLRHSTRPLSVSATTGPAQISFVLGGRVLVITEKATNTITTYTINRWGLPEEMHTRSSSSPTPFGFAAGKLGYVFVSEAVGGAPNASVLSSYRIHYNGEISLVDGSVGAGQSAACWVVLTKNEKYAYATNTASNNVSTFDVNSHSGGISVRNAISATTPAGPIDAALTNNSKFLYVLSSGGHSISAFKVGVNSSLGSVQLVSGLPEGATGLAAN